MRDDVAIPIEVEGECGDGDDTPSQCRFCLEEEDDPPLIRPCKCTGTLAHVHPHCLQRWLQMAPTHTSRTTCQMCHHQFDISYRHTPRVRYIRRCCMEPMVMVFPLQFVAFWGGYCINLINNSSPPEDASVILSDWPHNYAVGSTISVIFAVLVVCAAYTRMPRPRAPCRQFICAPYRDLVIICLICVIISVSIAEPILLRFAAYLLSAILLAGAVHMPSPPSSRPVVSMTFGEYVTMQDDS